MGSHVCLPILRPGCIETDAAGLEVEVVERELPELTDPQSCERGGLVEQPVERSARPPVSAGFLRTSARA